MNEQEEFEFRARAEREFAQTQGGAALGNPNITAQGVSANRGNMGNLKETVRDIGTSGVIGGVMGYFSPEIVTALGGGLRMVPHPIAQTGGAALMGAAPLLRAGRGVAAGAGAISGLASETSGKTAEAMGAGPVVAEGARIVGGGLTSETINLGKEFIKNVWARMPSFSIETKATKEAVKAILNKLETAPDTLTEVERKYVESQVAQLRGSQGKTDQPLEQVGSIMGAEGQRVLQDADRKMIAAQAQAAGVKAPGAGSTMADVGGDLQNTINTRYKAAIDARKKSYASNEKQRDTVVAQRENAGQTIDTTPEYKSLVASLKAELKPGLHSPDVAADFENILNQITTKSKKTEQPFGGLGADPFASLGEKKPPVSFNQIDEVRRQLGEVFRGKPPEGYKAIDAATARRYYERLSDLQANYAGPAQRNLLDDYAKRTEGLEVFSSKYGKKSTALDQYREDTFATDPSSLPAAYFKTKASVQALKELTGSQAKVNNAALEYANRELAGKDAAGVRKWMTTNAEWLAETGATRKLIDNYASGLEAAERSLASAQAFAKQAERDSNLLTRNALPAQRAVELIKSGDAELWSKVAPAVAKSPQAKKQMVEAVRQVIADQATAKSTSDFFSRKVRPFLEQSGIASQAEMDFIKSRLDNIALLNIPDSEKLGMAKRLLLNSVGGWAASAVGRGTTWSHNKVVPE